MASSSRSSSQQRLIKESEREEAADQRFGRQLLKNEGKIFADVIMKPDSC